MAAKQERLSNDEFLVRLAKYLNTNSANLSGSIHLTQKRLSHPSSSSTDQTTSPSADTKSPFPDINPPQPLPVLIRATNGKSASPSHKGSKSASRTVDSTKSSGGKEKEKWKIATVVEPDEIDAFFVRYGDVWRKEMSALKKRDRKKRKKEKKGGGAAAAAGL